MGNTLVLGLSIDYTLRYWPLAASTPHTNTVYHKALLGLVAEAAGLIGAGGPGESNDGGKLTVLPAANSLQKSHHITLLLSP